MFRAAAKQAKGRYELGRSWLLGSDLVLQCNHQQRWVLDACSAKRANLCSVFG
jgi:hypothetical protein